MARQTQRHSYEVHLKEDVVDELGITSPVETGRIDYYDSGLWVTTQDGRDFYTYQHVLTLRERPQATEAGSSEAESETTDAPEESVATEAVESAEQTES